MIRAGCNLPAAPSEFEVVRQVRQRRRKWLAKSVGLVGEVGDVQVGVVVWWQSVLDTEGRRDKEEILAVSGQRTANASERRG